MKVAIVFQHEPLDSVQPPVQPHDTGFPMYIYIYKISRFRGPEKDPRIGNENTSRTRALVATAARGVSNVLAAAVAAICASVGFMLKNHCFDKFILLALEQKPWELAVSAHGHGSKARFAPSEHPNSN